MIPIQINPLKKARASSWTPVWILVLASLVLICGCRGSEAGDRGSGARSADEDARVLKMLGVRNADIVLVSGSHALAFKYDSSHFDYKRHTSVSSRGPWRAYALVGFERDLYKKPELKQKMGLGPDQEAVQRSFVLLEPHLDKMTRDAFPIKLTDGDSHIWCRTLTEKRSANGRDPLSSGISYIDVGAYTAKMDNGYVGPISTLAESSGGIGKHFFPRLRGKLDGGKSAPFTGCIPGVIQTRKEVEEFGEKTTKIVNSEEQCLLELPIESVDYVCFRWSGLETLAQDLGMEITPTDFSFWVTLEPGQPAVE